MTQPQLGLWSREVFNAGVLIGRVVSLDSNFGVEVRDGDGWRRINHPSFSSAEDAANHLLKLPKLLEPDELHIVRKAISQLETRHDDPIIKRVTDMVWNRKFYWSE